MQGASGGHATIAFPSAAMSRNAGAVAVVGVDEAWGSRQGGQRGVHAPRAARWTLVVY
jgi:hypothetical protein